MSEEDILKNFVRILEDHFPEADTFRPRDIRLDKFVYVNDDEMDKRDEWAEDEAVDFSDEVNKTMSEALGTDSTIVPISSVDASSAQLGETKVLLTSIGYWNFAGSISSFCQYEVARA